ncbi:MAG: hypothetical protein RIB58_06245 [Phycisphaerales bacterium]
MLTVRTGLDIGPTEIFAAQVRLSGSGWSLQASAVMQRFSDSDSLIDEEAVALESLLFRKGFFAAPCIISAPQNALASTTMELPPATSGAPIEKLARAEFARQNQLAPDAFTMSFWDLPNAGRGQQFMAVGCQIEPIDEVVALLEAAGLAVAGVDDPARAMGRSLACVPTTATVRVGARIEPWGTRIVVLHHSTLLYARSLPSLGLDARNGDLPALLAKEIDACIAFARHRSRSHAPASITLLGRGASSDAIRTALLARFGDALRDPVTPAGDRLEPALATAVGLALLEDSA